MDRELGKKGGEKVIVKKWGESEVREWGERVRRENGWKSEVRVGERGCKRVG